MISFVRRLLKRPIERTLAANLVTTFSRRRVRGKRLVLAYHGITPRASEHLRVGERALYITQTRLAAQLDVLAEVADVVALSELDAPGDDDRPRVAISFDDAYQGAVTVAIDELVSRTMPATIFVAPGYLGGRVFWWDALAHASGELPPGARDHALHTLAGSDTAVREWAAAQGLHEASDLPPFARSATVDELRSALARPGISIGSHTWSHVNVARLAEGELASELAKSLDWCRAEAGDRFVPSLAYPYGHTSAASQRVARDCGYATAWCIDGGWHRATDLTAFARPRFNVSAGLSLDGFRARILGSIRA